MTDIWNGMWINNFLDTNRPNPGAVAYRYVDRAGVDVYIGVTGDYERGGDYVEIELKTYRVTRFSPKGFFIEKYPGKERFIAHGWRKKFAHLNQEEARNSFRSRKLAQKKKLDAQLKQVSRVLQSIENDQWVGRCSALLLNLSSTTKQQASGE